MRMDFRLEDLKQLTPPRGNGVNRISKFITVTKGGLYFSARVAKAMNIKLGQRVSFMEMPNGRGLVMSTLGGPFTLVQSFKNKAGEISLMVQGQTFREEIGQIFGEAKLLRYQKIDKGLYLIVPKEDGKC